LGGICLIAFLFSLSAARADSWWTYSGVLLTVTSHTDGTGRYWYHIVRGPQPYVWGFDSGHGIEMEVHQLVWADGPAGWQVTTSGAHRVRWEWAGTGIYYIEDSPLTFSVLSAATGSVVYQEGGTGFFPWGFLSAESYTTDHVPVAVGYQFFDYLGPVPEPTPLSLLLTVPVTFLPLMRRRR